MSIRPVTFNADGSIDVVYDETGHSGTIAAADVHWAKNMDDTDNFAFIVLNCPDGCGGSSTHPVGGGAAPAEVQQMFARMLLPPEPQACPCGKLLSGVPPLLVVAHMKQHADQMDYTGRWVVNTGDVLK